VKEIEELVTIRDEEEILKLAGQMKCKYSLSILDCFSLATAVYLKCPVFFRKEYELTIKLIAEIEKKESITIYEFPN
jgi:predicted nucleic acid-binding protein